ncbi:hypothetical protein BDZ89DRAFT_712693 [Hymenopellis radicata]|nr:hypothetical protein BDZ89DRAFT_712693 [Hymenopellis radicata]
MNLSRPDAADFIDADTEPIPSRSSTRKCSLSIESVHAYSGPQSPMADSTDSTQIARAAKRTRISISGNLSSVATNKTLAPIFMRKSTSMIAARIARRTVSTTLPAYFAIIRNNK